ncbi:MAG: PD40 domain-containing protein [Candidatus Krumholzibacteriota bacterium]|nr:PD40 domain-containing protein [Candidatus Krumholzibacteriota bacterium]
MRRILFLLIIVIPLTLQARALAQGKMGYYRYPAIHENTVIFTAEGDLWRVTLEGSVAQRLTTHHGVESYPAISPDGSRLAFSAQYEGPTEVYVMPLDGGLPQRKTFEGRNAQVVGWTPEGKLIYSTSSYSTLPNTQLVLLDIKNNSRELYPLSQASDGSFDPQGRTLFFTRLAFQGSHTKRYRGGTAQNLWKYAKGSAEAVPLTSDYPGTSKDPMWWEGRLYFVSDRDGTMNLWSMEADGGDPRQLTFHKGLDVSSPCLHKGKIVYQLVADLYLYDISSREDREIPVTLASDFDQTRERWIKNPQQYLTSAHLSPDGDRVALTSRGQVFVAPVEEGRLVRVTRKNGVRYRNAAFLPDGKNLLLLSDESGELEFHEIPANGVGEGRALTANARVFRYPGIPSPDGKLIAFRDKDYQLWIHDLARNRTKKIAASETSNFSNLTWSPDGKWLAYVQDADNSFSQIKLYNLDKGEITAVTSDRFDSWSPAWSPCGKWLYFLSDRHFVSLVRSPWGARQPEPFFDKTTRIYALPLMPGERSPFLPEDEVYLAGKEKKAREKSAAEDKKDKKDKKDSGGEKEKIKVAIELEGIQSRIIEVPVDPGDYTDLAVNDKYLFFVEREISLQRKRTLQALEIKNKDIEVKTLLADVGEYELSREGKKLMVRKSNDIYVFTASDAAPSKLEKQRVPLGGWSFSLKPRDEWRQMFGEAWRLERDYFYDKNMHGADYDAVLKRYLPYVDRITDREELNDLIAHMVGELSALHTFVWGGDRRSGEDDISQGRLGAELVRDDKNKGFRIEHIFEFDPDFPGRRPPLAEPGTNISEGDVITALNGIPLSGIADPAVLLKNQAGKQVLLTLISQESKEPFDAIVKPVTPGAESNLRYNEWEYRKRKEVEEKGRGEIGYVHLRAMGGEDFSEWMENFYPVFNRKGLIIDVRHNRGGSIDSWILEKLLRRVWFYWKPRVGKPFWNMHYAFRGHMVVLCNERTASDGEAFAEGFRRLELGKVIGTRTWGGEIWLSFGNWLVDRGIASAAEIGVYGPEGEWLIEGHGVEPDIVVDNLPHETFRGKDAQLEAALQYLKEKIKEEPVEIPPPPEYPDKSARE